MSAIRFFVFAIWFPTLKTVNSRSRPLNQFQMKMAEVNGVVERLMVILGDPHGLEIPGFPSFGKLLVLWPRYGV